MKLDPVPMQCITCKAETSHSVAFTEHAKAAGTLKAICSACGNAIVVQLTGMGRRASIADLVQAMSAMGSRKRKIMKGGA